MSDPTQTWTDLDDALTHVAAAADAAGVQFAADEGGELMRRVYLRAHCQGAYELARRLGYDQAAAINLVEATPIDTDVADRQIGQVFGIDL